MTSPKEAIKAREFWIKEDEDCGDQIREVTTLDYDVYKSQDYIHVIEISALAALEAENAQLKEKDQSVMQRIGKGHADNMRLEKRNQELEAKIEECRNAFAQIEFELADDGFLTATNICSEMNEALSSMDREK